MLTHVRNFCFQVLSLLIKLPAKRIPYVAQHCGLIYYFYRTPTFPSQIPLCLEMTSGKNGYNFFYFEHYKIPWKYLSAISQPPFTIIFKSPVYKHYQTYGHMQYSVAGSRLVLSEAEAPQALGLVGKSAFFAFGVDGWS